MHVFKLSMIAGPTCTAVPNGSVVNGACLVANDDASRARDAALLALNALGFQSCTFLDVVQLPSSPDLSRYSGPMRAAFDEAQRDGVSVMLYPSGSVS
ncbi:MULTISPECIES: hypothetical protein [unclassified Lysobacter]